MSYLSPYQELRVKALEMAIAVQLSVQLSGATHPTPATPAAVAAAAETFYQFLSAELPAP